MKYLENTSKLRVMHSKLCRIMPRPIRGLMEGGKCFWNPADRKRVTQTIRGYQNSEIKHIEAWKKAYRALCLKDNQYEEEARIFFESSLEPVKRCDGALGANDVILLLVVKNDCMRVSLLLRYYRALGVKRFAVLDDRSDDGTLEYLTEQEDVDVYHSNVKYSTQGRQAWMARLVDLYGFDRWYLIADSDELISYHGMDKKKLPELTADLDRSGRRAVRMMLLEMYPKEDILALQDVSEEEILSTYTYFDAEGYRIRYTDLMTCVVGGVRCRVFYNGAYHEAPYLTKYPLVKITEGMIPFHSHMNFPFACNRNMPLSGCILHYKFLPQDMDKYRKRAKQGNFQSGSKEYKKYIDLINKDGSLVLYDEKISRKYDGPDSLEVFHIERFE